MRLLFAVAIAATLQAQILEVASVKPNHTGSARRGFPMLRNGVLTANNTSLQALLRAAYRVSASQIDGPGWLADEYFDISAKAADAKAARGPLLQALLKERFHAVCRVETREVAAYDLVEAKGGRKLTPFDPAHPPEYPRNAGGAVLVGPGSVGDIASLLSGMLEQPVIDRTGIEGRFTYELHYSPAGPNSAAASSDVPDIFTAVREDLGLVLEAKKERLPVVVVERIDRVPAEN